MHVIRMPGRDESVADGTVLRWHKAEGQAVEEGELVAEVETIDAVVAVASAAGGVLRKVLVEAGTSAGGDTPIALIGDAAEDVDEALAALAEEASRHEPPPADSAGDEGAPPPARQAARRAKKASQSAGGKKGKAGTVKSRKGRKKGKDTDKPAAGPGGEVTPVLMPQAGQSMEEGMIVAWRVGPGDTIKVGQVIFDVETDKATIEVEAVDAGRLARIVVAAGETIAVKQPVGYLAGDDADVEAYLGSRGAEAPAEGPAPPAAEAPAEAAPAAPLAPPAAPAVVQGGRVKASPAARKLAEQRHIDLAAVGRGSGPDGRILSTDVAGAAHAAAGPVRHAMSGMRKAIARNLLHSKQTIPHFYARVTIDADAMYAFYREQKAAFPCTLNDVVTLACGRVIREFPAFRSRLDGDELIEQPSANIGIAVGREDGLVVPVVTGVERMSLRGLAAEARRLVDGAREGKVEGVGQGVFTITNLGMFGVEEFAAIINPPEAAILAVAALREDVVVRDGAIRAGRVMTLTLSVDHRVIDGLVAARFLARLKEVLEDPGQLA